MSSWIGSGFDISNIGNGGIGPSNSSILVYRPGGINQGNIYNTWGGITSAFQAMPGHVEIIVEDTYGVVNIDTSFDFENRASITGSNTTVSTNPYYKGTKVNINNGVTIKGITKFKSCFLLCDTTTSASINYSLYPSSSSSRFIYLQLEDVTIDATSSNYPVINLNTSGLFSEIHFYGTCYLASNISNPVIRVNGGEYLYLLFLGESGVYSSAISGSGNLYISRSVKENSFQTQTNFTGTLDISTSSIWGAFSANFKGDVVTYKQHPYTAINYNYAISPTNTTYWRPSQGNVLVFQPGGVDYGNVYTNWADVLTAFANTPGVVTIVLDGTFNSGTVQGTTYTNLVTIPTGYDFQNRVIFQAGKNYNKTSPTYEPIVISTSPGVQLKGVSELSGGLWLCDTSTSSCFVSPAPTGSTGFLSLRITNIAFVVSTSTNNAAIKGSNFCHIILDNGYLGGDGGDKPVLNTNGINNYIYIKNGSYIDQPTSAFTGTGSLNIFYDNASYQYYSNQFSSYTGTLSVSFTHSGWSRNIYYEVDQIVSYQGVLYKSIQFGSNRIPNSNSTYWQPLLKTGITYSSTTAYIVGDVVTLSGNIYTCKLATTGNSPPNSTYWVQLGAIGDTGPTGPSGPTGPTGDTGPSGAPGSAIGYSGFATLDFGNAPGGNFASVTVTGQTSILSGTVVYVCLGSSTADHNDVEHLLSNIILNVKNVTAGVGFTINAYSSQRLTKTFNVKWMWS